VGVKIAPELLERVIQTPHLAEVGLGKTHLSKILKTRFYPEKWLSFIIRKWLISIGH